MERITRFLQALKTNPRAAELTRNMPKPRNDRETIECYADLAVQLGCDLSKEEITEGLSALVREQRTRTGSAERELGKSPLPDDALDFVAGGAVDPCEETYKAGEWCWWTDSCKDVINIY